MNELELKVKIDKYGQIGYVGNLRILLSFIQRVLKQRTWGYFLLKLKPWYRGRTTGRGSQNAHINGHVQQIAMYTGQDFDCVKHDAKMNAIKRGYPYKTSKRGNIVLKSERDIDTVEAGYLIDQLHEDAAFLNVKLKEGY